MQIVKTSMFEISKNIYRFSHWLTPISDDSNDQFSLNFHKFVISYMLGHASTSTSVLGTVLHQVWIVVTDNYPNDMRFNTSSHEKSNLFARAWNDH